MTQPQPNSTTVDINESQAIELLKDRYHELQDAKAAESLRQAIEANVVRWRWASDEMDSPEPFDKERSPGGHWLEPDEDDANAVAHGFDAEGNVAVIKAYYPVYIRRRGEFIEFTRFHYNEPRALVLKHYYLQDALLRRAYQATEENIFQTTYEWQGDRLVAEEEQYFDIKLRKMPTALPSPIEWEAYGRRTFEYGSDSQLDRMVFARVGSKPEVEFRRTEPGLTAAKVAQQIEERLVKLIPEALATNPLEEPVYCIFLTYCSSGWNLHPNLCLAKASERDADMPDLEVIWNPHELRDTVDVDLNDRDLSDQWQLLYQLMSKEEDFNACPLMLRRVALRLNGTLKVNGLKLTDDYVLTSCDLCDGVRFEEDFRGSVPKAQLKVLRNNGYFER